MTNDAELVPQPHGGALMPPWTPATGAAANRTSMRAIRRQALALLAQGTPETAQRVLDMTRSSDERVSIVACVQVLDRVLGKPPATPTDDEGVTVTDLSHLTRDERAELGAALAAIKRLTGRGPGGV